MMLRIHDAISIFLCLQSRVKFNQISTRRRVHLCKVLLTLVVFFSQNLLFFQTVCERKLHTARGPLALYFSVFTWLSVFQCIWMARNQFVFVFVCYWWRCCGCCCYYYQIAMIWDREFSLHIFFISSHMVSLSFSAVHILFVWLCTISIWIHFAENSLISWHLKFLRKNSIDCIHYLFEELSIYLSITNSYFKVRTNYRGISRVNSHRSIICEILRTHTHCLAMLKNRKNCEKNKTANHFIFSKQTGITCQNLLFVGC